MLQTCLLRHEHENHTRGHALSYTQVISCHRVSHLVTYIVFYTFNQNVRFSQLSYTDVSQLLSNMQPTKS